MRYGEKRKVGRRNETEPFEIRYLLNTEALMKENGEGTLTQRALSCLDSERRRKVLCHKTVAGRCQSIGAGLLLQKLLGDYEKLQSGLGVFAGITRMQPDLAGLVAQLEAESPREVEYTYGSGGKPSFVGCPVQFSLSHSQNLCLCAASLGGVGADLQVRRGGVSEGVVRRVLGSAMEEYERISVENLEEREAMFYRNWARLEAYGKYTGRGVFQVLQEGIPQEGGLRWEEERICLKEEIYYLAICRNNGEEV